MTLADFMVWTAHGSAYRGQSAHYTVHMVREDIPEVADISLLTEYGPDDDNIAQVRLRFYRRGTPERVVWLRDVIRIANTPPKE